MTSGTAAARAPITGSPQREPRPIRVRRRWTYRVCFKRWFDIAFSLACLPVIVVFGVVIIVIVKLDTAGPVFVKLKRLGRNGVPFWQYKFRTMVPDAESLLRTLMTSNSKIRAEFIVNYKIKNDPRITRIGKWLRKTSLDELPQILNVLKGEMSWVGPRAIRDDELVMYDGSAAKLLSETPGLTGLWQVSGRSKLTYQERVRLDMQYIDNISFVADTKILLRTIPTVITGDGAV